ncbi:hypothetical protein KVF89_25740 [Nocardioides carbamazepini]|jgi:hypothetical protein|uniref:hypothetical protein n=1 Tax=Nocardioides carbamazepini TaxID=2854259 RepID=UPI00214A57DA|nr:hypothetical protein [Nocardioides carbamazepini]MCR1785962.1 hypothetical protein [Nocardioides carbamazepini]
MENTTMNPVFPVMTSAWQPTLSATLGCATSALATLEVQGIAARPATVPTAFAPFAGASCVAVAADAAKRERAITGTDHRGSNAAYVPGLLAWSPPI